MQENTELLQLDEIKKSLAKQMIKIAQKESLQDKIEKAILLLKGNEILHSGNGYYLAFSGGKDSIVIKELAKMANVKFESWYSQTTIDPPELIYFMQKCHSDVQWIRASKPLPFAMEDFKIAPTRLSRWCCKKYKETGGDGRVKIIGVRAEESPRRAEVWKLIVPNIRSGHFICPIIYWTEKDVWDFIKLYNLPYPSLYDEGFRRLGCIGCPMAGSKKQKEQFKRWPGFERLWKLGFQKLWNKWYGVCKKNGEVRSIFKHFKSWEEMYDWWLSGKGIGKWKEECQFSSLYSQNEG